MADHDPRSWRVATALAHVTGLDWARWAKGVCNCCRSMCCRGRICHTCKGDACDPVPAPWDTDAYLADCRRRGVEPGSLPSLTWGNVNVDADDIAWAVFDSETVIRIGRTGAVFVRADGSYGGFQRASIDDLVRATNLARVAAEAMR